MINIKVIIEVGKWMIKIERYLKNIYNRFYFYWNRKK